MRTAPDPRFARTLRRLFADIGAEVVEMTAKAAVLRRDGMTASVHFCPNPSDPANHAESVKRQIARALRINLR